MDITAPAPRQRAKAAAAGDADIKTYRMVERSQRLDFEIRDQDARPPVVSLHRHEFFQIEANLSGDSHHVIDGRRCPYPPRSLVFVLPYRVHCAHHAADPRYYVINFATDFLRAGFALSPLEMEEASVAQYPELLPFVYEGYVDFVFDEPQFAHIRTLLERLAQLHARRTVGTLTRIQGTLLELIGFATECHAEQLQALSEHRVYLEGRSDALGRVVKFIDEHLARPISLNEVAEAAFLSPNYLSQLLKKQTGQAFVEWLTARRMQRARELLAHTGDRVSAIAKAVGFADEAYFARRFAQHFGMPPSKYRQSVVRER
ncbi:AraC family transcriptional regulator [Aquincola sp. MAHUQ-54]|uniref:AraC family transcriptional regulator n=1 Tax=Aquincola agrisoli TaxID=3119538 RepID=A0AAW9QF19_9BURK